MSKELLQELVNSVNRLAASTPGSPEIEKRVHDVYSQAKQIRSALGPEIQIPERPMAPTQSETQICDHVCDQNEGASVVDAIDQMRSMAAGPAAKYGRMISILDGIRHAAVLAERPQNAAVRPRIALIVKKLAGVFKDIDTVQDLDKPLEQIEKAVHSLYGNQSKNDTYMFERRGKGHHKTNND